MTQPLVHRPPLKGRATRRGGKTTSPDAESYYQTIKRETLTKRLKVKADAADRGSSVSLAGKTDDEIVAALIRC